MQSHEHLSTVVEWLSSVAGAETSAQAGTDAAEPQVPHGMRPLQPGLLSASVRMRPAAAAGAMLSALLAVAGTTKRAVSDARRSPHKGVLWPEALLCLQTSARPLDSYSCNMQLAPPSSAKLVSSSSGPGPASGARRSRRWWPATTAPVLADCRYLKACVSELDTSWCRHPVSS